MEAGHGRVAGGNLDKRYPGGPAFKPYYHNASLLNLTAGISARDWMVTAFGSAVLYMLGHQYGTS